MPELPEVETTLRGISPHITGKPVRKLIVRNPSLRWPVPDDLSAWVTGERLERIDRRAKYLLLRFDTGTAIFHLGMSGSLRIVDAGTPARKHDHIDMIFDDDTTLRFHDPRRFGCLLWTSDAVEEHELISSLGPEPLSDDFDAQHLFEASRKRRCSVKSLIMNSHIVVGVGNIYASEALHLAGINPKRQAGKISLGRYERLTDRIRQVLSASIEQGGTTLRDFVREDGQPGYFARELYVYGRTGESCKTCGNEIKQFVQQQRSTFYCPRCQT